MACGCKKNKTQTTTQQTTPNYVVTNETDLTKKVLQALSDIKK